MRTLDSALATAIAQPVARMITLVKIAYDSGDVAWCSAYRDIEYGGTTYLAAGNLGSVSPPKEEAGLKAAAIGITITGVRTEVVSLVLSEAYLGRQCWVYYAFTDEHWTFDEHKVFLGFVGAIDSIEGAMGATASFSLTVKSRLADWERKRQLRYHDGDQQRLHPGDKGMEFIPQLSQKKIVWPRAAFLPKAY